jgi:hypothetical protein
MKFTNDRPYADPEKAARRIIEVASTDEPAVQALLGAAGAAAQAEPSGGAAHDEDQHGNPASTWWSGER